MSSMNNWLAFSLSPQEVQQVAHNQYHQTITHNPQFPTAISRLISGGDVSADCFGISSDTTPAPLSSFGLLQAFNRNNNTSHYQTHDSNMKGLDHFRAGNSTSELPVLVKSSCNQNNTIDQDEVPKLEDFLGGNSFSDNDHQKLSSNSGAAYVNATTGDHYMFSNCSLQPPAMPSSGNNNNSMNNSSSFGLAMIKSWLCNQPVPQPEIVNNGTVSVAKGMMMGNSGGGGGAIVGNSQSLSLSMSTGSQSSSSLPLFPAADGAKVGGGDECSSSSEKQQARQRGNGLDAQNGAIDQAVPRKSVDKCGQRTSIYRGVTRHRWTGRYEAHLWDNSCRREGQTRKGRQVYLGGYDKEDKAARSYDLAALKYWGPTTTTNFPVSNYEKELEEMKHMNRLEYIASLRRKSSGFSRGASIYRGVTRHHLHGRWQARIGRVAGNKDLYLGTFTTQEEAAEAYDIAAIKFRGLNAVTNFEMSHYDVKGILESSTLPIGAAAKRLKDSSDHSPTFDGRRTDNDSINDPTWRITDVTYDGSHYYNSWPTIAFQQAQPLAGLYSYPYGQQQQKAWCKQEQDTIMAPGHSLQDLHHLHLGSNTTHHNFFHSPSVATESLMSIDASSMEHSTGSTSNIFSNMGGSNTNVYTPITTVIADHHNQANNQGSSSYGDSETMLVSSDQSYAAARNAYYLSQQSGLSVAKANVYDQQSSACTNTWMPTAEAQAVMPEMTGHVRACHGAPLFTVWNDALPQKGAARIGN